MRVFVELGEFVVEPRFCESPTSGQSVLVEVDPRKSDVGSRNGVDNHLDRIASWVLGVVGLHARPVRTLLSVVFFEGVIFDTFYIYKVYHLG